MLNKNEFEKICVDKPSIRDAKKIKTISELNESINRLIKKNKWQTLLAALTFLAVIVQIVLFIIYANK